MNDIIENKVKKRNKFKIPVFCYSILILGFTLLANFALDQTFLNITFDNNIFGGKIINILILAMPFALMAIGETFVVASGELDLSIGLTVFLCLEIIRGINLFEKTFEFEMFILLALLIGLIVGIINGILVTKLKIKSFIATLITMIVIRAGIHLIYDGRYMNDAMLTYDNLEESVFGFFFGVPAAICIVLILFIIILLLTRLTSFGMLLKAVGYNAKASKLSGVKVDGIKITAYIISSICAAVAGILLAKMNIGFYGYAEQSIVNMLDIFLAIILGSGLLKGGKFSITGSLIGMLIIYFSQNILLEFYIPVEFFFVIKAVILFTIFILSNIKFKKAKVKIKEKIEEGVVEV